MLIFDYPELRRGQGLVMTKIAYFTQLPVVICERKFKLKIKLITFITFDIKYFKKKNPISNFIII